MKLFPFEKLEVKGLKAWRAVMDEQIALVPVGGMGVGDVAALIKAKASKFGLWSALYKAGQKVSAARANALILAAALGELNLQLG